VQTLDPKAKLYSESEQDLSQIKFQQLKLLESTPALSLSRLCDVTQGGRIMGAKFKHEVQLLEHLFLCPVPGSINLA
jgi:hypothetical protein